ncbi:putative G-protein coupled receptor [Apostichopus japonicus]|uniref:Putative G-protein coupled receptor n=1 Tax=Stichopus japonicus TaxID=307972 RepID=A0A2G8JVM4_STIJA|nr:putative G-protein coupled receptor [Apostichopus japonicus]
MASTGGSNSITNNSTSPSFTDTSSPPGVQSVVLQACSLALICMISCLLNAGVVCLFYKRSYLQTPGNRFILALSVSNLAVGIIVVPLNWISLVIGEWTLGVMMCYASGFFMMCVMVGSVWMVALITLDRYYAIVTPMLYSLKLTNHYSMEVLVLAWFLSFVFTLPPVLGWSTYQYSRPKAACIVVWDQHLSYAIFFLVTCAAVPFAIISVCYFGILRVARQSSRRVSHGNIVVNQPSTRRRGSRRTSLLVNIRMNSPTKALRTVFLTVGALSLVWCPFVAELMYEAIQGINMASPWAQITSMWLAYGMLIVNPLIYAVWNRSIRSELIGQYCPCLPRTFRLASKDDVLLFATRRGSHAMSISGSLADSSTNGVHSRFSGTVTTRLGEKHGSNDSGKR